MEINFDAVVNKMDLDFIGLNVTMEIQHRNNNNKNERKQNEINGEMLAFVGRAKKTCASK